MYHPNVAQYTIPGKQMPNEGTYKFKALPLPTHNLTMKQNDSKRWPAGTDKVDNGIDPYDPVFSYCQDALTVSLTQGGAIDQTNSVLRVFSSFNSCPKDAAVWCVGFALDSWDCQTEGMDKALAIMFRGHFTIRWLCTKAPIEHEQFCILPPNEDSQDKFRRPNRRSLKIYPRMCMLRDIVMGAKTTHFTRHFGDYILGEAHNLLKENNIHPIPRVLINNNSSNNSAVTVYDHNIAEDRFLNGLTTLSKDEIVEGMNNPSSSSSRNNQNDEDNRVQLVSDALRELMNSPHRITQQSIRDNTFSGLVDIDFWHIYNRYLRNHLREHREFTAQVTISCLHTLATYLNSKIALMAGLPVAKTILISIVNAMLMSYTMLFVGKTSSMIRAMAIGTIKSPLKTGALVEVFVDCKKNQL